MAFRIETPRLAIREWAAADTPAFYRLATDPTVMRHISGGHPWTPQEIAGFLRRQRRHARERGYCLGPLELRESGAVIGISGLQPLGTTGEVETGWWLSPERRRRGYATEAGAACLDFAFTRAGLPRVVAIALPANAPSIRVMERLGMRREGRFTGRQLGMRLPEIEVVLYAAQSPGRQPTTAHGSAPGLARPAPTGPQVR